MEKERIQVLENQIDVLTKEKEALSKNEEMFRALIGTSVGEIGQDFFNNIVIKLAEWLNTDCIILGQFAGKNKVVAVPMYLDGKIIQDFSYDLQDTPCDLTTKKGYCIYEENVLPLFPKSKDLISIGAQGYVGTALYNKNGEPSGVLCAISRNKLQLPPKAKEILGIVGARVTAEIERKKAYLDLEISEAKLKEANAAKDRLFSIIAHDLINPFNAILGFSELLLENISINNLDMIRKYALAINDSSNKSLTLLQNLLEWSRVNADRIAFNPENFNLADIFKSVIDFLNNSALQKKITLSQTVKSDLNIFADKNMIATIIRNLVSNAIKYTHSDGKITLSATIENNETKISVSDTGVGIKSADAEKLFSIENNISIPGTNNEKGTGLGLIICKEYVKKHNGEIRVDTEVGKGSIFSFTIPNV